MVKIIKHGKKEFYGKCQMCGCEFTYELDDMNVAGYVKCPDCGNRSAWLHANQSRQTKANLGTVPPCIVDDPDAFFIPVNNDGVKPL